MEMQVQVEERVGSAGSNYSRTSTAVYELGAFCVFLNFLEYRCPVIR